MEEKHFFNANYHFSWVTSDMLSYNIVCCYPVPTSLLLWMKALLWMKISLKGAKTLSDLFYTTLDHGVYKSTEIRSITRLWNLQFLFLGICNPFAS